MLNTREILHVSYLSATFRCEDDEELSRLSQLSAEMNNNNKNDIAFDTNMFYSNPVEEQVQQAIEILDADFDRKHKFISKYTDDETLFEIAKPALR